MPNNSAKLLSAAVDDSRYVESCGVGVFVSESLCSVPGLTHGFTARLGGVSLPPFDSLNLGTSRDEPYDNILANYRILCGAYGLDYDELALVRHEHGDNILRIDRSAGGRGVALPPLDFSDGFVTNDPGITLVTNHADCAAFFLYDPVTRSIGLAHAGWKGMFARIGQKLALRLKREFGAEPCDMLAVVGPCICENCFEVERELGERFAEEFDCPDIFTSGGSEKPDKAYVSLHTAALIQLKDAGVQLENIRLMKHCTMEERGLFYSYRRDGKNTGSMAAFLRLR